MNFKHFTLLSATQTNYGQTLFPKPSSFVILALLASLACPALAKARDFTPPSAVNWVVDAGEGRNICLGDTIQLTATGANTYQWFPADGLSCTACADPLAFPDTTTLYFVLGDDGSVDSVLVSVFTLPQVLSLTKSNPTDCNVADGSIAIGAVNSGGGLEYSIDGGNAWFDTPIFTALPAGNYAVFVRNPSDACGIVAAGVIQLVAPQAPQVLNILTTNPTLCDTPNGSIVISAAGGSGPLLYSIDGGFTWQNQNIFQLLGSGLYTIKVSNANGSCQINGGTVNLVGSPDEAYISSVQAFPPSNCDGTEGSITVVLANDTGNFEFSVNGGINYQSSKTFLNLQQGIYHVLVRRADGSCLTSGGYVQLVSPANPVILGESVVQPKDCLGGDGTINILAFGAGTLEFSIDGGNTWQSSNDFEHLGAGMYIIAVRNFGGACVTLGDTVVLTQPNPPLIAGVDFTNPTACGLYDGSITIDATGDKTLEFSINGGSTWSATSGFQGLSEGMYQIAVRYQDGSCAVSFPFNPLVLDAPGAPPAIIQVKTTDPGPCQSDNGSIQVEASGTGSLLFSIDGGVTYQSGNAFHGLTGGTYVVMVKVAGSGCTSIENVVLANPPSCLDTVQAVIPADIASTICLDPSVFNYQGLLTGAGFCGQGNPGTVVAVSINQACVTLLPATGFSGLSPHLICLIHCFNNNVLECDTTYISVTVQNQVNCDHIFAEENVLVPFAGNPTPYCVPLAPLQASAYNLALDGIALGTLQGCDFDSVIVYTYAFLPGGGFSGPYILDSWSVNGVPQSGFFNNANELLILMNALDPGGNWQISTSSGIIFGGDLTKNYGDMLITHFTSGTKSVMTTNFSIIPNGFIIQLDSPDEHILVATDPVMGCSDTLVINANIILPTPETIFLTTFVNTPTGTVCIDGSEMPTGMIQNLGYCGFPQSGVAPIVNDSCVFYLPNPGFVGTDTFCVSVCDNSFPFQVCDTTFFIVNVQPKTDTVSLIIPGNAVSADTCLGPAILQLPGAVTLSAFCGLQANELLGTIDQQCLSFSPVNNFTGLSTVCVVFCSGSMCDTTVVLVTVEPPVICNEIFLQDVVTLSSQSGQGAFCIPINTGEIVGFDVFIDGNLFTQSYTPCSLVLAVSYDYGTLPAGPYFLEQWTVDGVQFFGLIPSIDALVDSMNVWDPAADWVNNSLNKIIITAATGSVYGNLVISQIGGSTFTLSPGFISQPAGSQVPISGFGSHEVIVVAANGCADTATVVLEQIVVSTDTVHLTTLMNTPLMQICTNTGELTGPLFSIGFCTVPSNGGIAFQNDTCVNYNPVMGFIGTDDFCIVLCDDSQPPVCDTFVYLIQVLPPTDTIFIDAPGVEPFQKCLNNSILQLPGNIVTAEICGMNANQVALTLNANCVTIDPADGFNGVAVACVVHCDDSTPPVCDTTILLIQVSGGVPCPVLFDPAQVTVSTQNGSGQVCLPITPNDIGTYNILLDGAPYGGMLAGCNFDSAYIYFYGLVVGQGNTGPYSVTWQAFGNTFSATVNNVQQLVDSMNVWDPLGNWTIEPTLFILLSSFDNGDYGTLNITHLPTGSVSNLGADFNGIPAGTLLDISGVGQHQIVLVNTTDGCADTLLVNAVDAADIIQITTFEDVPSTIVCIDTTGLPGNFSALTICGAPQSGMFITSGNCFTYNPGTGFIGNDEGCLLLCDDQGNCDTTYVLITVEPLCSLFDFFPDGVQNIEVNACQDLATWCVPYRLDSMVNFGVLDNGFPYTGGFQPCDLINAQIQFDTGFHEIIFIHLNTGCRDTLLVEVSCKPDTTGGCGVGAISAPVLYTGDCSGQVQFCVNAALSTVTQFFFVTDNGAPATLQPCDLNNLQASVVLDTGFHQLVFSDTVKGCADTFLVEVKCGLPPDATIDTVVELGNTLVFCLADLGYNLSQIDSVVNECTLQSTGNALFEMDENTWCFTVTGQNLGQDTACFKVYLADTSARVLVHVTVIAPCPDLLPDSIGAGVIDCTLGAGLLCLPIPLTASGNLVVEVNGQPYSSGFTACNFDSIYVLNYSQLPSMGLIPPYVVESWSINGTVFTGVFSNAQQLADSMNLWDAAGTWQVVIEPVSGSTLIVGGSSSNVYGAMQVEQQLSGIQVSLGINATFVPLGIGITLPVGTVTVTVRDSVLHCKETFTAILTCLSSHVVVDTVLLDESDTFCLDLSELPGQVVSIENACPGSNGETVTFVIQDTCVVYTGLEPGVDSACIVVCNDLGVCDTTFIFITVVLKLDSVMLAVNDTILTGENQVVLIPVLDNDQTTGLIDFFILTQPAHGQAAFLLNGMVNYVPNNGYCNDLQPDSFTYVICNPLGCDTATVFVTVQCSGLVIYTGFSPNGDGLNDYFKITGLANYPNHRLRVFNRWGNLVLDVTNYQSDWNGTWEGKALPDGTYFYVLDLGEGNKPRSGFVQLNR